MNPPLFQVGEEVIHLVKGKRGKVVDRFHDGKNQRYYVVHSGWTWSVPEQGLDSKNSKIAPLEDQRVTRPQIPFLPQDRPDPAA